jgi:hypothetical protein
MPLDLRFSVENAKPELWSASPLLLFELRISQPAEAVPIHAIMLRCQVRIEPARRRYGAGEAEGLRDLFGTPDRWGQTQRPMLWTHTQVVVGPFEDSIVVDLPVPCTFDFNVAATRYFHALEEGEVPLSLLFSGTVFQEVPEVGLQVAQIPWDREAAYRLPVRVWQGMMERYYPDIAWLQLRQDLFDRLIRYKNQHGLPTWEQVMESLLAAEEREAAGNGRGVP